MKSMYSWVPIGGLVGALILMYGCSTPQQTVKRVEEKPFEQPPLSLPETTGSLWQEENGRAYLFEDRRASRVGDIVVVQIVEQHRGSKTASTTADRESTYRNSIGGSIFGFNNFASTFTEGLGIDSSTQNEFEGSGSTSREDTLTGTIATRVTEVLPNGDLRIQGKREVTVNSEKQTMILNGIVRRIDLDTSNSVLSSAVAEAKIEYTGLGVVDDVQRPGWLVRILDWIIPF
ncbi:MAG: flagellar basal body L-ring protein FlgH [Nitrospira sp.]|nr:flagellar basal body L-ring protein FlgH [Nitrospira sp.]